MFWWAVPVVRQNWQTMRMMQKSNLKRKQQKQLKTQGQGKEVILNDHPDVMSKPQVVLWEKWRRHFIPVETLLLHHNTQWTDRGRKHASDSLLCKLIFSKQTRESDRVTDWYFYYFLQDIVLQNEWKESIQWEQWTCHCETWFKNMASALLNDLHSWTMWMFRLLIIYVLLSNCRIIMWSIN